MGNRTVSYAGRTLFELRKAKGLSQQQLADRAHVGVSTIQFLEEGRRKELRGDTARKLAIALEADASVFFQPQAALPKRPIAELINALKAEVQELEHRALLRIPVVAEGSAGMVEVGEYIDWLGTAEAADYVRAVKVVGDCLMPDLNPGDVAIADTRLAPNDRAVVVCLLNGIVSLKRYREMDGRKWLENRFGHVAIETCEIQGVVIAKQVSLPH